MSKRLWLLEFPNPANEGQFKSIVEIAICSHPTTLRNSHTLPKRLKLEELAAQIWDGADFELPSQFLCLRRLRNSYTAHRITLKFSNLTSILRVPCQPPFGQFWSKS